MTAKIYITIEDDTPEEQLIAAGGSREKVRDLYYMAFKRLLDGAITPGCKADLRVVVDDATGPEEVTKE